MEKTPYLNEKRYEIYIKFLSALSILSIGYLNLIGYYELLQVDFVNYKIPLYIAGFVTLVVVLNYILFLTDTDDEHWNRRM